MFRKAIFLTLLVIFIAGIPRILNYQGKLLNSSGVAVNDTIDITFRLFREASGGEPLWIETVPNVPIINGLFSASLGLITPFPDTVDFSSPYFLEVQIGTETLLPREKLASVPYALSVSYLTDSTTFSPTFADEILKTGGITISYTCGEEISFGDAVYLPGTLSGWSYRQPITIANGTPTSATNYQIRIKITSSNSSFWAHRQSVVGNDVRFTDTDGASLLKFWKEAFVDLDSAVFWVRVPNIPAMGTKMIYLYYGNPSASSGSDFDNTFTKDYGLDASQVALYHLDEGSGGNVQDASGNLNHGTVPLTASWGSVDGGQWDSRSDVNFSTGSYLTVDAADEYVTVPHSSTLNLATNVTIEGWLKGEGRSTIDSLFTDEFETSSNILTQNRVILTGGVVRLGYVGGTYNGWKFRKPITINNTGGSALTDYQVLITNPVYNEDALVSSWHFSEGNGSFTFDNAVSGGIGNLVNGPVWVNGIYGKALDFDGVNDYVEASQGVPSQILGSNVKFVIMWVYPRGNANGFIYMGPSGGGSTGQSFRFVTNSSRMLGLDVSNGIAFSSISVELNKWNFIFAYWSGSTYYVGKVTSSGIQRASLSLPGSNLQQGFLRIGQEQPNNYYTNGIIDEVKIYNRILSDAEILALYEGKANLDYSDIRFSDSDGSTELNYWMEGDGRFWVKVPNIPGGEIKTIYIYFGNLSAISTSNGRLTFEVFDDFNDGILDNSYWTVDISSGGSITEGNGELNIHQYENYYAHIQKPINYYTCVCEMKSRAGSNGGASWGLGIRLWWNDNSGGNVANFTNRLDHANRNFNWTVNGSWNEVYSSTPGTNSYVFHRMTLSSNQIVTDFSYDGRSWSNYYTLQRPSQFSGNVQLVAFGKGFKASGYNGPEFNNNYSIAGVIGDNWVDWVRIRKYASPEPSVSIGLEQSLQFSSGYIITKNLNPTTLSMWRKFFSADSIPPTTHIKYSILDTTNTPIIDSIWDGEDISSLPPVPIRLKATLYSNADSSLSPFIKSWAIQWLNCATISKGSSYGLGAYYGDTLAGYINGKVIRRSGFSSSNWNHCALTYDGTKMRLYLNGAKVDSVPLATSINLNTHPLTLGKNFSGSFDEIRIYNRALPDSEIVCHYERRRYLSATPGYSFGSEESGGSSGLRRASATSEYASSHFLGFAMGSCAPRGAVPVRISGVASGFSGLTPGADYYLQDEPGGIGTSSGTYTKRVGTAIAPDRILISR